VHFKKLQGNLEFHQNKCHPRNVPDTRRQCAKATDQWAQAVASQPNPPGRSAHFVASRRSASWWIFPRGGNRESKAENRWRSDPVAARPRG
jgi:hypothetical protein